MQTDLAIDLAGYVWVMNNWQDIDSCFAYRPKHFQPAAVARRHNLLRDAKPVRAPQIGPAGAP